MCIKYILNEFKVVYCYVSQDENVVYEPVLPNYYLMTPSDTPMVLSDTPSEPQ